MASTLEELAYDEARHDIDAQGAKINALRGHSFALVSVAAASAAFLSRDGRGSLDRLLLIVMLAALVAAAALALNILRPREWKLTRDVTTVVKGSKVMTARTSKEGVRSVQRDWAHYMCEDHKFNQTQLDCLYNQFSAALGAVVVLVLAGAMRLL